MNWQAAGDQQGYTGGFVVQVLGAMFGQLCNRELGMQWRLLSDADGVELVVEGVQTEVRCFPFAMIDKRIRDGEHGFFRAVFTVLQQAARDARSRD